MLVKYDSFRVKISLFTLLLFVHFAAKAQKLHPSMVSLSEELGRYSNITNLPAYLTNTMVAQTSSYDTTGGNDDGFDGTYSFVRKEKDSSLVIADIIGAGVVNRIWTPTPTNDTLDFYLDDTSRIAFSIRYADLFSNKVYPFINPLCGNELGGYYCYLPIPFQSRCKIVYRGKKTQFHQIQYRLYPAGTQVKKFELTLDEKEKNALKEVADRWNEEAADGRQFYPAQIRFLTEQKTISLSPGRAATLFNTNQGGRITQFMLEDARLFEGLAKAVDIRITWDNEQVPAVYCPVADFFGYAFGKVSMQSLLLGTRNNRNYCYFPMPFDKAAKIELIYRTTGKENKPIQVKSMVQYTTQKRNAFAEGRFYARWNSNRLAAGKAAHIFLNQSGKGHYVGSLLLAQGLQPGMTYFFEGDDSTSVDGQFRMHGTGSEDYFNGGWYAFPDRWSRKLSLPLHGSLDYSLPFCRTGAYRFYLGDKISFEKNIFQSIEHGPQNNSVSVQYTSLAFYYGDTPPEHLIKPSDELAKVYMPDTLVMYPQLMNFNVWDNIAAKASWLYNTGGQSFNFSVTDESRLRLLVAEIPDGRYKVFADFTKTYQGCSFSLWQGQSQVCDWIATSAAGKDERLALFPLGEINIREFFRTLTFQFKTTAGANSLLLSRLVFVPVK